MPRDLDTFRKPKPGSMNLVIALSFVLPLFTFANAVVVTAGQASWLHLLWLATAFLSVPVYFLVGVGLWRRWRWTRRFAIAFGIANTARWTIGFSYVALTPEVAAQIVSRFDAVFAVLATVFIGVAFVKWMMSVSVIEYFEPPSSAEVFE